MSEKFQGEAFEADQLREYDNLLSRAQQGVEVLSFQERERLVKLGYYYLEVKNKAHEAILSFEALHNFEGLRKIADQLLLEQPDSYHLPHVLVLLEDHEGLRNLLNRGVTSVALKDRKAFNSLNQPLYDHRDRFLDQNRTPVATGGINEGVDLVAIRNLSRQYDVAVPIARGGLNQGAIASLWGMPTRIVDIAAHNRKVPKGKWINPVAPEDFAGKRVLLFDKDAVTGASIRKAVKMLTPFQAASIGVYFTHNAIPRGSLGLGTITESLPAGLEVFYPDNAPLEKAGDAYIEAHEKLGTLYGRRRLIERLYAEKAKKLKKQYPDLAEVIEAFISKQLRAFDSLNPALPGISEVREKTLLNLDGIYQRYLKDDTYNLPGVMKGFREMLVNMQPLVINFEAELISARYDKQAEEAAQKRKIENPHYPSNPLAAFSAARRAVKKGFDIALIVGPEGFAYEPYFRDLGLPTLAVNIPESTEGGSRTITLLDDLSILQGKKVLVVEDDVRTGATLQKLIENFKSHAPARLGLYLGQSEHYQKVTNIPADFKDTYIAGTDVSLAAGAKEFHEHLKSKGLRIFKMAKMFK